MIVDDIIDTGSTIFGVTEWLYKSGAAKIIAFCTHGLFSKNAITRLNESPLERLFVTDSISLKGQNSKIQVLSIAPLLSEAIRKSYHNESVSSLFE